MHSYESSGSPLPHLFHTMQCMEFQIEEIKHSLKQLECFGTDVAIGLIENMYYGKDFEKAFHFEITCSKKVKKLVLEYSDCQKLKYKKQLNGRSASIMCERRKKEICEELMLMQNSVDIVGADIAYLCVSKTKLSQNTYLVFLNSLVIIDSVAELVRKYVELTTGREFDFSSV